MVTCLHGVVVKELHKAPEIKQPISDRISGWLIEMKSALVTACVAKNQKLDRPVTLWNDRHNCSAKGI